MCPPALDSPEYMVLNDSNEEAILYLDSFKPGSPLPRNVIEDINPYQYRPSRLPDGIWYIVHSTENKKNEFGFWEVKEEAYEIFTNSCISGWRTTLEFFELKDSLEQPRTNWVMEEYSIIQKGESATNKEKELRKLCRVFLRSSNKEMLPDSRGTASDGRDESHMMPSIAPSVDNVPRKGSPSESLMKDADEGTTFLSVADKLLNPWGDLSEQYVLNGDYLELDDLVDPQSHSTSSENSGRSSMTFDEYFDPIALLQELENNNNQDQQGKDSSSRFSVVESSKSFEVVMQPATSGSLVYSAERQEPTGCQPGSSVIETKVLDERTANHTVKRLKAEQSDQGPRRSHTKAASSSTNAATQNGKKKVMKNKRIKKYFCFMPF